MSPSPPSTPPPIVRSMRKVAPPSSAPTDSPSVLNVLVDHHGDDEGGQGVVPRHDEHDHQAEHGPQEGGGPVVVAEARTPARGLQDGLNERGQVYKHVAHEEEPGGGCVCVCWGGDEHWWRVCVCVRGGMNTGGGCVCVLGGG